MRCIKKQKADFYIEIMRHNQEDENRVNESLISLARKHNVKIIATNNTFYIEKSNANAHDILLCVRDGEKQTTPIGRGRGYRYGLPNQEYYFKSGEEMKQLFNDLPEAISNIAEIVDKIEIYNLAREVLLPKFEIPAEFNVLEDAFDGGVRGENAFLRHLTFEGAKLRYKEITPEIQERLDFELLTIENSGYPGYFLIVQDFIAEARKKWNGPLNTEDRKRLWMENRIFSPSEGTVIVQPDGSRVVATEEQKKESFSILSAFPKRRARKRKKTR